MTKKTTLILIGVIIILLLIYFGFINKNSIPIGNFGKINSEFNQKNMKITSPTFANNKIIPTKYTCQGDNMSPPLAFSDVPKNTKSLVLIVDDPDVSVGDWVHWLVWNIDPTIEGIEESEPPGDALYGKNDFGDNAYGGPCPPQGTHRYQFKLYALNTLLDLPEGSRKGDLEKAMEGHILDQAILIGLYKK